MDRQYVGIDFHRRRSVIVRLSGSGERLGLHRIANEPFELAKVIANGVPGTAMMPFKTRFSEQEILALAKYVRHFDKNLKDAPGKTVKKKTASKP